MTFRPADLATLRLVGSPTLAPDGTRAVAVVQSVDQDSLTNVSRLWSFPFDGSPAPLTGAGAWTDSAPVFSPDGDHVAYLSTKDGRKQAYAGDRRLSDDTVVALDWLTDTDVVAVVERRPDVAPDAPVVVDWLRFKRDGGPSFVEPTHELWLLGVDREPRLLCEVAGRVACLTTAGGAVLYAVEERHSDVPTAGVAVRRLDPATGADELLWTCPAQVAGIAVTDVSGIVVVVSSGVAGHSVVAPRLWVLEGGAARPAFPGSDLECERGVLGDSRPLGKPAVVRPVAGTDDVVFAATVGHDVALFVGDVTTGAEPRRLTQDGCTVTDFSAGHDGRFAVCVESSTSPVELYLVTVSQDMKQASDLNAGIAEPVAPEPVTIMAVDGLTLHGLLYRAGPAAGPLVVRVHGGPHLAWGTAFGMDDQTLVSAGYHVLLPNLRGSAGRGTDFRERTVGQWGRADYYDLMSFVDDAVDRGVADPERLFLTGGSYGGFLTNWTLACTDRFRAAVSERSISNFLSKFGTSDNGYTVNRHELGGADLFDDSVRVLLERSPLRHAAMITTPMLLIHGEDDYRCPIEQSEQLFVALRRHGVPARFARFPGASHNLATAGRPDHRIARLDMILAWFAEHS